ncbi:MAG: site-specific DNA-methyltransferase [Spirochaetia bacterium]|nr:site-specific DNA-methyltransferase [Spirochaetia bacterium]
MSKKLELVWEGKETPLRPEPRILIEKPELSYSVDGENVSKDNILIHGDNLLALKALEKDYSGKVKCIYIDPPYNTGSAFEHYDDNFEHSTWLNLMKGRLEILNRLLSKDGSIWISIDDDEGHYLKVLCDEIFGRNNFVSTIVWQKIHSIKNDAKYLSSNHDFILLYAKNKDELNLNLLPRTSEMNDRYKNPDNDPRGPWQSGDLVANEERTNGYYDVISPLTGKKFNVPIGKHWVYSQENLYQMIEDNRIWFGKDGNSFPRKKRFLSEVKDGRKGDTWWISDEVGHNQESKREIIALFGRDSIFATPKPERLIQRVLTLATNEGDLVLDSFLGSGTTAAVAQKMGRRWIGIEMGNHAYTHCKVRLDKVISGEDKGGITKDVNYQGGGSYKFYELAPTLIVKNALGIEVINKEYNAEQLAAAVALHEGYDYQPDENIFWKQSKASENSYLFVTTSYITPATISQIEQMMGKDEYLLIACKAFDSACEETSKKITIKKIPQMLLKLCEFGKDDYSLNIVNPPFYEDDDEE